MKKLVVLLGISILVMAFISGLFFNQLNTVQDENNNLRTELFDVSDLLEKEQNQSIQLEAQVGQLQNQNKQLGEEILELEKNVNQLQGQNEQLEEEISKLGSETLELEQQLVGVENQRNQLEQQINKFTNIVKITEFVVYGLYPVCGMYHVSKFNLTIHNFGVNDVENLSFSILTSTDELALISINITNGVEMPIDVIQADEELRINGAIGDSFVSSFFPVTITLTLGDTILDEYTTGFSH